jgi:drug/metabolite transporter (DMT)-like permease
VTTEALGATAASESVAIKRPAAVNTALGIVAIVFWSSSVAVLRSATEKLGIFTASSAIYLSAAAMSLALAALRPGALRALVRLPRTYLLVCGGLFTLHLTCLSLALGLASDRYAAIVVGIINYLWPALTLVFAVPILKRKARWMVVPGMLLAFAGSALAPSGGLNISVFLENLDANLVPYLCALVAAFAWGLYSNFSKRLGTAGSGVPLFLIFAGALLGVISRLRGEESQWCAAAGWEIAYMALCPAALGYLFWDRGVRKGNLVLLATLSYFIPVCSTIVSAAYLRVALGAEVWAACALVTVGALVCNFSFRERPAE